MWTQNYNPLGNAALSTVVAMVPAVTMLGLIAFFRVRVHLAALIAVALAFALAVAVYRMPADMAAASCVYGAAFGLFPVSWIVINIVFLYHLTLKRGHFDVLRDSLGTLAPDPRIQAILVAFCFGAFLEGMAGFGAPAAITAAILLQLGFKPLHACGLSLLANTAPVAFGSLGIPITTLAQVTGLDARMIGAMVGRQLPLFSLIIPFWLVLAFAGWRGLAGIWPVALVAGVAFAAPQFLVSNYHGPWLVDTVSGVSSMVAVVLLLRVWKPREIWRHDGAGRTQVNLEKSEAPADNAASASPKPHSRSAVFAAWLPWGIMTLGICLWCVPQFTGVLDKILFLKFGMFHLHHMVQRIPPIVLPGTGPEPAAFSLNLLSATGTGIFVAALVAGLIMNFRFKDMARVYGGTLWQTKTAILTIAAMLAFGNLTKYSGTDGTLGLALAHTGVFYPFFGTVLGWLGVALTGSDTSSNVLFGSLQTITAHQTGISPILMAAANTSGGVMGKMLAAQSIVIASTATDWYGNEGKILRYVFFHSVALVTLMGIVVTLQAYVVPFTHLVVK
jgi:lactate permease